MVNAKDANKINTRTIALVDSNKEYTVSELTRAKMFPWHKDHRSYRRAIMFDLHGPNILKVKITGEGRGRDYKIKGKNLIAYLTKIGEAMILVKGIHNETRKITSSTKASRPDKSTTNQKRRRPEASER